MSLDNRSLIYIYGLTKYSCSSHTVLSLSLALSSSCMDVPIPFHTAHPVCKLDSLLMQWVQFLVVCILGLWKPSDPPRHPSHKRFLPNRNQLGNELGVYQEIGDDAWEELVITKYGHALGGAENYQIWACIAPQRTRL